jgi:NTP pyrophosphatase (non-canonical NTP hydrolase)
MTLEEMSQQCLEDSERWFGDSHTCKSIPHHTLAMCGEVGEFANVVKKIERGSLQLGDAATRLKLAMELADTFTYMLNLAGLLGIDLEKTYHYVRGENEKRFMAQRAERASRNGI